MYYSPNPSEAFWHGTLDHLQVGPGKGFLISLMSQRERVSAEFADIGPQNDEKGQNVRSRLQHFEAGGYHCLQRALRRSIGFIHWRHALRP